MLSQKIENGLDGESLIDKMFEMSSKTTFFSHENIKNEIGSILLAASDISSTAVTIVIMMLAIHSSDQEKLFQEILSIMPKKDSKIALSDLNKLTFLDQCINESMRIFPPVPIVARESSKPLKLTNGIVVPPGVPLIIGYRPIQNRSEYWGTDAHVFNPLRFDKDLLKNSQAASFIPYSYGSRDCVGELLRLNLSIFVSQIFFFFFLQECIMLRLF